MCSLIKIRFAHAHAVKLRICGFYLKLVKMVKIVKEHLLFRLCSWRHISCPRGKRTLVIVNVSGSTEIWEENLFKTHTHSALLKEMSLRNTLSAIATFSRCVKCFSLPKRLKRAFYFLHWRVSRFYAASDPKNEIGEISAAQIESVFRFINLGSEVRLFFFWAGMYSLWVVGT